MRVLVAIEGRFVAYGGDVFHSHLSYDRFWKRYLDVFDSVSITAREIPVARAPEGLMKVTGPNVTFAGLPDYHGPWRYLRVRRKVRAGIREAIAAADAHILRAPGMIATLVWKNLPKGTPFAVEVVGDPWFGLARGGVKSLGRPVFRRLFTRALRAQCQQATAALYVTKHALQRRYPPSPEAYATGCSDAQLSPECVCTDLSARLAAIAAVPARLSGEGPPVRLGFVGSFGQVHKLPHVHIGAVARCVARGANVVLEMVGDGAVLERMKRLAQRLGMGDRVTFRGRLPGGQPIFDALDTFDVFLNATASEGLPRAVVEAMARGCPCIASNVGGIPELVEPERLVPPGDPEALAQAILRLLNDPPSMKAAVERNTRLAREYTSEVLDPQRRLFYQALRERTEGWLANRV